MPQTLDDALLVRYVEDDVSPDEKAAVENALSEDPQAFEKLHVLTVTGNRLQKCFGAWHEDRQPSAWVDVRFPTGPDLSGKPDAPMLRLDDMLAARSMDAELLQSATDMPMLRQSFSELGRTAPSARPFAAAAAFPPEPSFSAERVAPKPTHGWTRPSSRRSVDVAYWWIGVTASLVIGIGCGFLLQQWTASPTSHQLASVTPGTSDSKPVTVASRPEPPSSTHFEMTSEPVVDEKALLSFPPPRSFTSATASSRPVASMELSYDGSITARGIAGGMYAGGTRQPPFPTDWKGKVFDGSSDQAASFELGDEYTINSKITGSFSLGKGDICRAAILEIVGSETRSQGLIACRTADQSWNDARISVVK